MSTRHEGGCHCGAVRWSVVVDEGPIPVIDCNCSICTKKGFLHLIVASERFALHSGADDLVEYRFGTKTAVHRFCRHCGIHSFYVPRSHPDKFSVNAKCIDDFHGLTLQVTPFDGQNWEENVDSIREA